MFTEPARHWQKFSKYYNKQASVRFPLKNPRPLWIFKELKSHYIEDKKIKTITIFCNGNTVETTKILLSGKILTPITSILQYTLKGKLAEPGEDSFRLILNYISDKVGTKLASTRSS